MERTDYGTLLIPDMKISDAGTYLCIGTNAVGSSEAVIDVTVIKGDRKYDSLLCGMQSHSELLVKINEEEEF